MRVYGAITVLKNKKELDWDDAPLEVVLSQLKENGLDENSEYGKDWIYSGDLDELYGDIYLAIALTGKTFKGRSALDKFLKFIDYLKSDKD